MRSKGNQSDITSGSGEPTYMAVNRIESLGSGNLCRESSVKRAGILSFIMIYVIAFIMCCYAGVYLHPGIDFI